MGTMTVAVRWQWYWVPRCSAGYVRGHRVRDSGENTSRAGVCDRNRVEPGWAVDHPADRECEFPRARRAYFVRFLLRDRTARFTGLVAKRDRAEPVQHRLELAVEAEVLFHQCRACSVTSTPELDVAEETGDRAGHGGRVPWGNE